jgi:large subunit ribosomal protein L4
MIKLALRSALSDRANEGKIVVVDSWGLDTPSTKSAAAAITTLGLTGTVLVVHGREDIAMIKSFRNLQNVQLIEVGELNAYDVLCNETIVFTPDTLPTGTPGTKAEAEAETAVEAEETEETEES